MPYTIKTTPKYESPLFEWNSNFVLWKEKLCALLTQSESYGVFTLMIC